MVVPYYKEEKEARLYRQLSQKAIDLAMEGNWVEAETVNRDMIERFPADVEAYNRLARALTKLGDFIQAKETYLRALSLDPDNAIAKRNLDRLATLSQSEAKPLIRQAAKNQGISLDLFAAEMGKAGIVELRNVASGDMLAKMATGDIVRLKVAEQRLIAEDEQGIYLGEVEPRHAARLIRLMNGGNQYDAAILNIGLEGVHLIVKEIYQHPSQVGCLSFHVKDVASFRTYARSISNKQDIDSLESELDESDEDEFSKYDDDTGLDGFTVLNESPETSDGG
jgi:hypothetical protein